MRELHGAAPIRAPKPPGIPEQMWKQLATIAFYFTDPTQFRERAINLGKQFGIDEQELAEKGIIEKQTPKPTVSSLGEKILTEVRRGEYDRLTPGITEAEITEGEKRCEETGNLDESQAPTWYNGKAYFDLELLAAAKKSGAPPASWNEPKEQQNPFDKEKRDPDPEPKVPGEGKK